LASAPKGLASALACNIHQHGCCGSIPGVASPRTLFYGLVGRRISGLSVLPAQRFRSYCAASHPQGDRIVVSDEGPVLHLIDLAPMQQVATPTLEALAAYLQQHKETLAARGGTHWDDLAVVCRLCTSSLS